MQSSFAGFRMLYYTWTFLLLLIMMASYILEHGEGTPSVGTAKRGSLGAGARRKTEWTSRQQVDVGAVPSDGPVLAKFR